MLMQVRPLAMEVCIELTSPVQMLEKEPSKRPSIDVLKNHRWFRGMWVP